MNNKITIIALIGEAGSGKDALLHKVMRYSNQFHEIVSNTSRPIREREKEGINYYYKTTKEFLQDLNTPGKMLEFSYFNGWYYGTSMDAIDPNKINIGVFNPQGIINLLNYQAIDFNLKVFRIQSSDKSRLLRQLNRENNPNVDEIIRRYTTDKEDFKDLNFDYTIINNNEGELESTALQLLGKINEFVRP